MKHHLLLKGLGAKVKFLNTYQLSDLYPFLPYFFPLIFLTKIKIFPVKIFIGQRYFKSQTRKFMNDICQFKESKWNSLVISIFF